MLAAARKAKSIDIFGLVNWKPGVKGPAAFPNDPNGIGFICKAVNGKWVLQTAKPYDVWGLLGIARS